MNKEKIYHYLWWIVWLSTIFIFSSIPDLTVAKEGFWDLILRNIGHALAFGVLFILSLRVAIAEDLKYPYVWALAFTLGWAVLDELHQTYITGRVGDAYDVFIDSIGMLVFLLFSYQSVIRKRFFSF